MDEPHGASEGTIVMDRGAGRAPGGLEVSVEQSSAGLLVISPIGELDLSNRDLFLDAVEQARADPATALVIDLSGLTFMDSSGLRVLIDAWNESKVSERRLTVVVPKKGIVRRVLEVSGCEEILPIVDRLDAAL